LCCSFFPFFWFPDLGDFLGERSCSPVWPSPHPGLSVFLAAIRLIRICFSSAFPARIAADFLSRARHSSVHSLVLFTGLRFLSPLWVKHRCSRFQSVVSTGQIDSSSFFDPVLSVAVFRSPPCFLWGTLVDLASVLARGQAPRSPVR
jgi:hypothetical protein